MNNFTDKQKEIVARKLGYDGPMQGFDDFINSSPSLGMKYSMLSDKFAARMAKGGVVRKKFAAGGFTSGFTDAQVASYIQNNALSGAGLTQAAQAFKLDPAQVERAQSLLSSGDASVKAAGTAYQAAVADRPDLVAQNLATYNPATNTGALAPAPAPTPVSTPVTMPDGKAITMPANYDQAYVDNLIRQAATQAGGKLSYTDATTAAKNLNIPESMIKAAVSTGVITGAPAAAGVVTMPNGTAITMPANYDQAYVDNLIRQAATQAGGTLSYTDLTTAAKNLNIPESMIKAALSTGVITGAPIDDTALKTAQAELVRANAALAAAKTEAERQAALAAKALADAKIKNISTQGGVTTSPTAGLSATGAPSVPGATTITAAQTATPAAVTAPAMTAPEDATVTSVTAPAAVVAPTPITAQPITAASAAGGVTQTLAQLIAQTGTVSEAAKAAAAIQEPATTAVAGMQAAQGVAGTVQGAPTRTAQAGEMVSGSAVDMARAEEAMAKTQAAQGVVTEEMTVQGQLNKLLTSFDAGNPPPWAAASMRTANAQLAARGLGASSMAGQAIIQATLEAATPIAAADAKVFETMGLQNLSNRQQTAMLVGQQRAAFLGQEFDQAFQTRVLNAARVADIANKNFDAQTQIAIENSRLANSMDIANLSAKNAVVMGKMAQMSQLETTNLNNRQQVAVENAKAFLTMDIKNLDNRQQTALFKAQEMNDALVSDAGFTNAVNITNSQNKLEADKVSATMALSAATFNADMAVKVNMANALAANELGKFNAQQANAREEFNSNMTAQINLANAKILAEVSTANTAATNAANAVNAKNATDLSAAAYAQQSQTYRDLLEMSWKTGESEKDRATSIVAATLSANASTNAATTTANSAALGNIAKAGISLLASWDKVKLAGTDIKNFFTSTTP